MTITPSQAGFIKGLGVVLLASLASYLANVANLQGVFNPVLATLIAALASSLESHLKSQSGNQSALFGAVRLK